MSWDIKYRPKRYTDVLNQEKTVAVLKQTVLEGKGFHSSYLFAGLHGGGKTTLARILARALLCSAPVAGEPCDQCSSCLEILETSRSETFIEIDAATNSGKDDIRKILEDLDFSTFSGKRRIYLLDESHQLSKDALDALLKPIEDVIPGSEDRRLVCLFCTTEPEKMRATIGSRCGPTFMIKVASPRNIAERLLWICEQEGKEADLSALEQVAVGVDGHIRDAIRAVEMLALGGKITVERVSEFLGYNLHPLYLDMLLSVESDLPRASQILTSLYEVQSPGEIYSKLAAVCLTAYKASLGISAEDSYWDQGKISTLGQKGDFLLHMVSVFSTRPRTPTRDMVECDLFMMSQLLRGGVTLPAKSNITLAKRSPSSVTVERVAVDPALLSKMQVRDLDAEKAEGSPYTEDPSYITEDGVCVHPRFKRRDEVEETVAAAPDPLADFVNSVLSNLADLQQESGSARGKEQSETEAPDRE